ncbi:hypothetical protein SAMN05216389_11833 [Oceanobacillus limi]|uniref:Integral membrane protein n=1 Tax=Oceanobacillus limi TaxID=930131 RepID=A0A1I0G0M9_9BACI|nr:hypothetical protein [Oceanobacillus limi]SET64117.1 hypothetical protein SAMN05216389_11833 [Oceanobacillus limi]
MINIFFGFLFIFFKTNLSFLDIGITYSITNVIGYISIFFGLKELGREHKRLVKLKPYVIFMVVYSSVFFLLNVTGNSPVKLGMSSALLSFIAIAGLFCMIAGMFMVFYIISAFLEGLDGEVGRYDSMRRLEKVYKAMMSLFFIAGICFFFFPFLAKPMMAILLLTKGLFLYEFYQVFIRGRKV